MAPNPCSVCGNTDMNLVDGFYYCIECGTQDANLQETVIENMFTLGNVKLKSVKQLKEEGVKMSAEWYKWHAYNFILCGLADELISLGAKPSFKVKLLWIWTRYIKKYQNKKNMSQEENYLKENTHVFDFEEEEQEENEENAMNLDDDEDSGLRTSGYRWDIKIITRTLLITMIYVALNLDKSDIQISHLLRFIDEGRLSVKNVVKFIPPELDTNLIKNWKNFIWSIPITKQASLRIRALVLFKTLKLGSPVVPDLKQLIENYSNELCLPRHLKQLVYSLMHLKPCRDLYLFSTYNKGVVKLPDYEGTVMSYIFVALKMCFGLDGHYELMLSETVEKINNDENYLKSYKIGSVSEPTERLFSFREWCSYLKLRKTIVCKHVLYFALQYNMPINDFALMEQLHHREKKGRILLSDEVTMNFLNKIPFDDDVHLIKKDKFKPTLTPLSTYAETIAVHSDPEQRLLLNEDFTQYSLQYACENLQITSSNTEVQTLSGVSLDNLQETSLVYKIRFEKYGVKKNKKMIFVKNCDNRNWFKTNRPTLEHAVFQDNETQNDTETTYLDDDEDTNDEECVENFLLNVSEDENKNIFDDDFCNIEEDIEEDEKESKIEEDEKENRIDFTDVNNSHLHDNENTFVNYDVGEVSLRSNSSPLIFDPSTFDRNVVIKQLLSLACKKHKVSLPHEYKDRQSKPRKRKPLFIDDVAKAVPEKKERVTKERVSQAKTKDSKINKNCRNNILTAYYNVLKNDITYQIADQLQSVINESKLLGTSTASDGDLINASLNVPDNHSMNESVVTINSNIDPNADKSSDVCLIQEISNTNEDRDIDMEQLIRKDNPLFDEKTHKSDQLYIKFLSLDNDPNKINLFDNDTATDHILEKVIDNKTEMCDSEPTHSSNTSNVLQKMSKCSDDDSIQNEPENLSSFVKFPNKINNFNYWLRIYDPQYMSQTSSHSRAAFDVEVIENFPPSFQFVFKECASLIRCSMCQFYRAVDMLECSLVELSRSMSSDQ